MSGQLHLQVEQHLSNIRMFLVTNLRVTLRARIRCWAKPLTNLSKASFYRMTLKSFWSPGSYIEASRVVTSTRQHFQSSHCASWRPFFREWRAAWPARRFFWKGPSQLWSLAPPWCSTSGWVTGGGEERTKFWTNQLPDSAKVTLGEGSSFMTKCCGATLPLGNCCRKTGARSCITWRGNLFQGCFVKNKFPFLFAEIVAKRSWINRHNTFIKHVCSFIIVIPVVDVINILPENTKRGKYHCTFDLFRLVCFANINKNCQLSYSWFQTSQTVGQWYSDTSPYLEP